MSKKNRQTTVNNIQNLNLEIDYDKLADSIIKAEQRAKDAQVIKEKNSFKRKVWHIIINKKEPQKAYTAYLMANILSAILNMCAIFCIVFFVFFSVRCISNLIEGTAVTMNITAFIVSLMALPLVSLFFRACANEMSQEENRDYIVATFSGLTGLAALIVAIVALVK